MKVDEIVYFLLIKEKELKKEHSLEYLMDLQMDFIIVQSKLQNLKNKPVKLEKHNKDRLKVASDLVTTLLKLINKQIINKFEKKQTILEGKSGNLKRKLEIELEEQMIVAKEFKLFIEQLFLEDDKKKLE